MADPLVYGNAERYLQLAIQAVLDVSHHIVADMELGLPADSQALFTTLARHKVLPARLAKKLVPMAGFRNVLVHEYLEIDRRRGVPGSEAGASRLRKFRPSDHQAALSHFTGRLACSTAPAS